MSLEIGFVYEGHQYYESNTVMNYTEAEEYCAERNSTVVIIETLHESHMLGDIVFADRSHGYLYVYTTLFCIRYLYSFCVP